VHELGIVFHIADTLEQVAKENRIHALSSVTLEIGEVSGIVPYYLVDCWNYFRVRKPLLKDAEMKIETVPAVTWCTECKREYPTVEFGRTCPNCGSEKTYLLHGNECEILQVETPEETPG
jgi:hydrogenase nickel incorporation protein HypA/HybF